MAQVELIMPKMGESVAEATIISWQKEVGETIEIDETVVEIATDKVDSEVPSSVEGVLVKKLFEADDVVKVGEVFAIVETEGGAETTAPVVEEAPAVAAAKVEDQVAQVQEIKTLNLSDLVLAVRPEVQPGERLNLKVVREGKENSQGIAYLEDGTMVVIEEGLQWIGKRIEVVVTGALQTPTGRMVFSKASNDQPPNTSEARKASQG